MSILTQKILQPNLLINSYSKQSCGSNMVGLGGTSYANIASVAYPAVSLCIYIPFRLNSPAIATLLWCYNGSVVLGNVDMGIYAEDGTAIVTKGSTAQSGTTVLQSFDIADTLLGAGTFYLGISIDNTTATLFRGCLGTAFLTPALGILEQASTFPLPATATFASATNNYLPLCGVHLSPRTLI